MNSVPNKIGQLPIGEIAYCTHWGFIKLADGVWVIMQSWSCQPNKAGTSNIPVKRNGDVIIVLCEAPRESTAEQYSIDAYKRGESFFRVHFHPMNYFEQAQAGLL